MCPCLHRVDSEEQNVYNCLISRTDAGLRGRCEHLSVSLHDLPTFTVADMNESSPEGHCEQSLQGHPEWSLQVTVKGSEGHREWFFQGHSD